MSLSDAIATQALWIQVWVAWLAVIAFVAMGALALRPKSRQHGGVIAVATLCNYVFMQWLYAEVGYVRLLGLAHVMVWGPLALYLVLALRGEAITSWVRAVTLVFLVSICISLAFDVINLARWLLGERGALLPA